ncbi:hypothetical protein A3768_4166 (plasmid) [Ralstonia solanacearum]|nr:hypothetical protein F504_3632 [Ralstonia pseudosolanacearum FQY_4]ANH34988.1 hypothetical protein A3768_4166 [Ralstonia solanacearum]
MNPQPTPVIDARTVWDQGESTHNPSDRNATSTASKCRMTNA